MSEPKKWYVIIERADGTRHGVLRTSPNQNDVLAAVKQQFPHCTVDEPVEIKPLAVDENFKGAAH